MQNQSKLVPAAIALSLLALTACSSDDDDNNVVDGNDNDIVVGGDILAVLTAPVTASIGGSFSSADGSVTVNIPPGALAEDSTLVITEAEGMLTTAENQSAAGDAFAIDFGTTLSSAAELIFAVQQAPEHPTLAESATIVDGEAVRQASFFRASDNTVLSLITSAGTYQPILRTLQADSGDMVERGRDIFLDSTFGNEDFFGGVVGLNELLNNLTPSSAVGVGAQIDIARVPAGIVSVLTGSDFAAKQTALEDPAITRALLQADAVVGVKAIYADPLSDIASSVGLTCALCHARVTPSSFELAEGEFTDLPIGPLQLDGVPNTSMDVGTILSLTPFGIASGQETIDVLQSWGPGRFDARALPDNPLEDGFVNPTSIPTLWNFADLSEQDYAYNWDGLFRSSEDPDNAIASRDELVFDLALHANGAFGTDSSSVPIELAFTPAQAVLDALVDAEDQTPGNVIDQQSLLDLQAWERSITSPAPGEFDEALAETGFRLFYGPVAQCSSCHSSAEFTGPVLSADIVLQQPLGALADGIKTPGLRGISAVSPYFHDDSAATLEEVVEIYSGRIVGVLDSEEQTAIVEYLKSL